MYVNIMSIIQSSFTLGAHTVQEFSYCLVFYRGIFLEHWNAFRAKQVYFLNLQKLIDMVSIGIRLTKDHLVQFIIFFIDVYINNLLDLQLTSLFFHMSQHYLPVFLCFFAFLDDQSGISNMGITFLKNFLEESLSVIGLVGFFEELLRYFFADLHF